MVNLAPISDLPPYNCNRSHRALPCISAPWLRDREVRDGHTRCSRLVVDACSPGTIRLCVGGEQMRHLLPSFVKRFKILNNSAWTMLLQLAMCRPRQPQRNALCYIRATMDHEQNMSPRNHIPVPIVPIRTCLGMMHLPESNNDMRESA